MDAKSAYGAVLQEMKKHVAGKEDVIKLIFVGLVANGHVLLEGVPGVAKTTITKRIAEAIQADFRRIQGTADLEIKDVIGYTYLDEHNEVKFREGPIFTNLLLIDELNRAPPKITTALIEALEERQVTIGNTEKMLKTPFMALATQNPLSIEGTVPLSKVLSDRFIMRIGVNYPSMEEEKTMLRIKEHEENIKTEKVLTTEQILQLQASVEGVGIGDEIIAYITRIVNATRNDIHIMMGASPRAEINMMQCGKALALIEGRNEVMKDDIKFLAKPILSHRLVVRATGGVGVGGIIDGILASLH